MVIRIGQLAVAMAATRTGKTGKEATRPGNMTTQQEALLQPVVRRLTLVRPTVIMTARSALVVTAAVIMAVEVEGVTGAEDTIMNWREQGVLVLSLRVAVFNSLMKRCRQRKDQV